MNVIIEIIAIIKKAIQLKKLLCYFNSCPIEKIQLSSYPGFCFHRKPR